MTLHMSKRALAAGGPCEAAADGPGDAGAAPALAGFPALACDDWAGVPQERAPIALTSARAASNRTDGCGDVIGDLLDSTCA
jgi:hypothetical protein